MRRFLPALLLCGPVFSQAPLTFTIDQGASQWQWSGDTSIGPLIGNPSTSFALAGTFDVRITAGNNPIDAAQFVSGGSALVVPNLSGKIPNPIPGFPPLAVVDITGLELEFTSIDTPVLAGGAFNTTVIVTALAGTLTVTPLVGQQTVTDLTGTAGDPTPMSGTLTQSGNTLTITSAQMSTFVFTDPGSGITGTIDLNGDLEGDHDCTAPVNYCSANLNSSGAAGSISSSGSTRIQDNGFILHANQLPTSQFAYFLMSESETFVPNFGGSQGNLCVGSPQFRFSGNVLSTGGTGSVTFQPDLGNLPQAVVFQVGEEWNFQLWYRDVNPTATSNTTDGLKVVWCP